MKKIILIFEDDLTVLVEADGFVGKQCEAATRPYEEEFGGVVKRTAKPEARAQTRKGERER